MGSSHSLSRDTVPLRHCVNQTEEAVRSSNRLPPLSPERGQEIGLCKCIINQISGREAYPLSKKIFKKKIKSYRYAIPFVWISIAAPAPDKPAHALLSYLHWFKTNYIVVHVNWKVWNFFILCNFKHLSINIEHIIAASGMDWDTLVPAYRLETRCLKNFSQICPAVYPRR
jgi:hypothetical protein